MEQSPFSNENLKLRDINPQRSKATEWYLKVSHHK